MNLINRWPDSAADSGLSQGVSRWLKLFSMEKIRETPLRDFFTGELYRPPFMFNRQEEETLPQGLLKGSGWLSGRSWTQDLSLDDFPALCDGKPIARAIYRRFSEGQKDWSLFFSQALKTDDFAMKAKAQRLLLLMVSEFGPHPAFAAFVEPLKVSLKIEGSWDIYRLTPHRRHDQTRNRIFYCLFRPVQGRRDAHHDRPRHRPEKPENLHRRSATRGFRRRFCRPRHARSDALVAAHHQNLRYSRAPVVLGRPSL